MCCNNRTINFSVTLILIWVFSSSLCKNVGERLREKVVGTLLRNHVTEVRSIPCIGIPIMAAAGSPAVPMGSGAAEVSCRLERIPLREGPTPRLSQLIHASLTGRCNQSC